MFPVLERLASIVVAFASTSTGSEIDVSVMSFDSVFSFAAWLAFTGKSSVSIFLGPEKLASRAISFKRRNRVDKSQNFFSNTYSEQK